MLATSCGAAPPVGEAASQPSSPSSAPNSPVSSTAVTTTPPPEAPKEVKATGDALRPRKVAWTKATPVSKGRKVRLVWWSGVEPCTVLDRVKVKETRKRVTITLYEGTSPKAKNVSCIMIAVEKATTVKLKSPLGKRKIVDGGK